MRRQSGSAPPLIPHQGANFIIAHSITIRKPTTTRAVSASEPPLRDWERSAFDLARDVAIRDAVETAVASSL